MSAFHPTRDLSIRHIAVVGVMALATLAAAGKACAAADGPFQSAFQSFNQASAGNASAVDAAADAFDALLQAEPANPVLLAYSGAATTMKASTTSLPWKKMGYAEDGLARIDKALAMLTPAHDAPLQHNTPGALEVRFVAATTFLAVPPFMNRADRGAKLLADVLASPLFERAPLPFKGAVWMRAAALAAKEQRKDDARRHLDDVIRNAAPQADAARAKLKELA
ncbi:MAG TPA: hypothetical protein VJO99_04420 [Burkholderiaceae bacterium]|nr:hypothetical protein [Burkholderiaceae bacterium]